MKTRSKAEDTKERLQAPEPRKSLSDATNGAWQQCRRALRFAAISILMPGSLTASEPALIIVPPRGPAPAGERVAEYLAAGHGAVW